MNRIEHYTTYLRGGAGAAALKIFNGIRKVLESSGESDIPQAADFEVVIRCRDDQPLEGAGNGALSSVHYFSEQVLEMEVESKIIQAGVRTLSETPGASPERIRSIFARENV